MGHFIDSLPFPFYLQLVLFGITYQIITFHLLYGVPRATLGTRKLELKGFLKEVS